MLDLIRQHRNLFSIIFVISAAGMVIGMFASPGSGGSLSGDVVAKVEGHEIRTTELVDALNRQMAEVDRMITEQVKKQGPESRKFFEAYLRAQVTPDRVLQNLVQREFLVSTAQKAGMVAPSVAVRSMIQDMDAFHDDKGHFDPLLYRQRVDRPAVFEKELAAQAQVDNLRSSFYTGLGIMGSLETEEQTELQTTRVFESLSLDPRTFPEPRQVSDQEVAAFLQDPTSAAVLQSYYDRHIREFRQDEQVHAKHILVREDAGGLEKIKEVLADIRAGKMTWDEAAKKYSADASNAKKGGDLGFFGRGQMDPAFESAAFALTQPQQISEPVKSSFGYHLILLVAKKPALNQTLDQVRDTIARTALLEKKRQEKATTWLNGWLAKGVAPSAAELKQYGLQWKKLEPWSPLKGPLGGYGTAESHLTDILALNAAHPLLKQPLLEGDHQIVLKWVKNEKAETQQATEEALTKANQVFQHYLQTRYEALEKNKKIVRSEKTLEMLRERLKPQS